MTKAEFFAEHGAEWLKFSRKPIFAALLTAIDEDSPARSLHTKPDVDRLHGASVMLNEIAGYERLRSLLVNLANPEQSDTEVPDTFDHAEKI